MRQHRMLPAVARHLACAALLIAGLVACAKIVEPARDLASIAALERLSVDTTLLLDDVAADAGAPRAARYAALGASAVQIAARAEARAAMVGAEYGSATAAFLSDYRHQLDLLAARDAAGPVAPEFLALRRAAIEDALADALFHERDALDRDR